MKVRFVQGKGWYQIRDLKNNLLFENTRLEKVLYFIRTNKYQIISSDIDRTGRTQGAGIAKSKIAKTSDRVSKQPHSRFASLNILKARERIRKKRWHKWTDEQLLYLECLSPSAINKKDWTQTEKMAGEALANKIFDFN